MLATTDGLGFTKLDERTIARLCQTVERRLNGNVKAQTPEAEIENRRNQHAFMDGLERSNVPLNIIAGVVEAKGPNLDYEAVALMVRIAIRFGAQLQRAIDAHVASTPRPSETTALSNTRTPSTEPAKD
jgi:hypothetical protein